VQLTALEVVTSYVDHAPGVLASPPCSMKEMREYKARHAEFSFDKFASERFNLHKKGLFGRFTIEEMISFQLVCMPVVKAAWLWTYTCLVHC